MLLPLACARLGYVTQRVAEQADGFRIVADAVVNTSGEV
jgi:hypothetical protein